jgi:hypothetical protein
MNSVGVSAKRTINDILTDSPKNDFKIKRSSSLINGYPSINENNKDIKMKIEERNYYDGAYTNMI